MRRVELVPGGDPVPSVESTMTGRSEEKSATPSAIFKKVWVVTAPSSAPGRNARARTWVLAAIWSGEEYSGEVSSGTDRSVV